MISIIVGVFSVLIGSLQENMFYTSIIKKMYIYQTDHYDLENNKTNFKEKSTIKISSRRDNGINNSGESNSNNSLLDELIESISNRARFAYTIREYLCFKLMSCCLSKKRKLKGTIRNKIFKHGITQLKGEIEITNILKTLQIGKLM